MAHGAHVQGGDQRALTISAVLTGVYFVIEITAGILIGSVAVISDAFHTFSAVGGVVVAIVAARLATAPPTATRTFGLLRAEIFGAFVNGFFLLGMALLVLWMGSQRLADPKELEVGPMLLIAAGGLVTEVISLWLLFEGQKTNLNTRGAYWHVIQTFVGSLIIIVAALVIRFTDFLEIDPLLGMAFGLVLLWASYGIIKESLDVLLDRAPSDLDLLEVQASLEALPGAESAHHIHAWSVASGRTIFTAHLLIDDQAPEELLERATAILRDEYGVWFSTLQLERECFSEEPPELEFQGSRPAASTEPHQPEQAPGSHAH
jgi:cobalt-zinc-cadmium efflux system protein